MAGEKTRAELDAQIDAGIRVNGNKEITPPIHNAIEKAITNSYVNKKDSKVVPYNGFLYWTPDANPLTPASGDVREGIVGSELQLQKYNGATWDILTTRDI